MKHTVTCGDCVWYDDANSACNRTKELDAALSRKGDRMVLGFGLLR